MSKIFAYSKSRKAKAIVNINSTSMSADVPDANLHVKRKRQRKNNTKIKQHTYNHNDSQYKTLYNLNHNNICDDATSNISKNVDIKNKSTNDISFIPKLDNKEDILGFVTTASKCIRSTFDMLSNIHHSGSICFMQDKIIISCSTNCVVVNAELDLKSCDIEDSIFNYTEIHKLDSIGLSASTHRFSSDKMSRTTDKEKMFVFHLSFPILNQCMSSVTHADIICMKITKESYLNKLLTLEIHNKKHRYVHSFSIPIEQDYDKNAQMSVLQHMKLGHEKKFKLAVHMSTQEFLLTLRTSKKSGNTLQILANQTNDGNNWCHFCTAGIGVGVDVISSHRFLLEDDMNFDTQDETMMNEDDTILNKPSRYTNMKTTKIYCNSESVYSTPLLISLAKTSSASRVISLYCNESKDVLGIKHRIGVIGVLMCMMAPLEKSGNFNFEYDENNQCHIIKKKKIRSSNQNKNDINSNYARYNDDNNNKSDIILEDDYIKNKQKEIIIVANEFI